jgi:hypothetical protein
MKQAIVKNCADEAQMKEAQVRQKDLRDVELSAVRSVMSTREGRRFVYRFIYYICHYHALDAQHSGSMTYVSLGERNISRILLDEIHQACTKEQVRLMEDENGYYDRGKNNG